MNKIKNELQNMTAQDLYVKIDLLRRDLLSLRLQDSTKPVADKTQFKKLRKDIARALTYFSQKI